MRSLNLTVRADAVVLTCSASPHSRLPSHLFRSTGARLRVDDGTNPLLLRLYHAKVAFQ
jgi:hypothetical protein